MKLEDYKIDRSEFDKGEWDSEPDIEWCIDETTGYPLIVKRQSLGFLCGYVGVPEGHRFYNKEYYKIMDMNVYNLDFDIFGLYNELTYSGEMTRFDLPKKGYWYFGFDCAHLGNRSPHGDYGFDYNENAIYITFKNVKKACEILAKWLFDHRTINKEA